MIKVLFFAQLREKLDCSHLDLPISPTQTSPFTVADLKNQLIGKGETWQLVFTEKQVLAAVNQVMCTNETTITDGDEVAFFPPVTGG